MANTSIPQNNSVHTTSTTIFPPTAQVSPTVHSTLDDTPVLDAEPIVDALPVTESEREKGRLANEDPITGEKGAHPVGTGLGAALGGATTGAVIGAVAGPVGALAGTIVGGIAGALAGKAIAEEINPTLEIEYWKSEYRNRPYYNEAHPFETYARAYRAGWESSEDEAGWESAEAAARQKFEVCAWENEGGAVGMSWEEAREAARDAYERIRARRLDRTRDRRE